MFKKLQKINVRVLISLSIILLSALVGYYFYPLMPSEMVSHWDFTGEPDGYMSREMALSLMPAISLILFVFYLAIPHIPLMNTNLDKFRKQFDNFMIVLFSFLAYLYLVTLVWNFYETFDIIQMIAPAFAVVFVYAGILIEHAKQNLAIGIRTPWTLGNEKVWDKTHRLGAALFKFTGLLAMLGVILPDLAFYFILVPIVFTVIYTVIYSWMVFRKETAKKKRK